MSTNQINHSDHLATYLNDHLAGATLAIELLEYLSEKFPGTAVSSLAVTTRGEVVADRDELVALMLQLAISQSTTRKVAAWISEKIARAKLILDDSQAGNFQQFEALELVSLGIEGKRTLWVTLQALKNNLSGLGELDFARLIHRAEDQRSRVEIVRIDAARTAFSARSA